MGHGQYPRCDILTTQAQIAVYVTSRPTWYLLHTGVPPTAALLRQRLSPLPMGTRERAGGTAQAQAALVGGRGGNKGSGVVVRHAEMEKQTLARYRLYRVKEHTGRGLFAATYSIKIAVAMNTCRRVLGDLPHTRKKRRNNMNLSAGISVAGMKCRCTGKCNDSSNL